MLNHCSFIGNLGKDPEIRTLQNGDKVANFSIACTEKWKDKNSGEQKERTTWVPVVVWGALAGVVERFLHKGSKVYVSGKFSVRKWQDQSGADRWSTDIVLQGFDAKLVMLDGANGGGDRGGSGDQQHSEDKSNGYQSQGGFDSDLDDEVPF